MNESTIGLQILFSSTSSIRTGETEVQEKETMAKSRCRVDRQGFMALGLCLLRPWESPGPES